MCVSVHMTYTVLVWRSRKTLSTLSPFCALFFDCLFETRSLIVLELYPVDRNFQGIFSFYLDSAKIAGACHHMLLCPSPSSFLFSSLPPSFLPSSTSLPPLFPQPALSLWALGIQTQVFTTLGQVFTDWDLSPAAPPHFGHTLALAYVGKDDFEFWASTSTYPELHNDTQPSLLLGLLPVRLN